MPRSQKGNTVYIPYQSITRQIVSTTDNCQCPDKGVLWHVVYALFCDGDLVGFYDRFSHRFVYEYSELGPPLQDEPLSERFVTKQIDGHNEEEIVLAMLKKRYCYAEGMDVVITQRDEIVG